MDAVINKVSALKREIGDMVEDEDFHKFPIVIHFQQGMENPKFKITVEKIEDDFYTDKNGTIWKKIKEETEGN